MVRNPNNPNPSNDPEQNPEPGMDLVSAREFCPDPGHHWIYLFPVARRPDALQAPQVTVELIRGTDREVPMDTWLTELLVGFEYMADPRYKDRLFQIFLPQSEALTTIGFSVPLDLPQYDYSLHSFFTGMSMALPCREHGGLILRSTPPHGATSLEITCLSTGTSISYRVPIISGEPRPAHPDAYTRLYPRHPSSRHPSNRGPQ